MAKCEMISVQAGSDGEDFVPVEKHCDGEAVGLVEGVVPACWDCAEAARAEGISVAFITPRRPTPG